MKLKIGVIGSADTNPKDVAQKSKVVGREIAKMGCILLTGSSPGIPYEAVGGAKEIGGFTVGISPASNLFEHVENYKFPENLFDLLIFTGFGYKGRNVVLIRSCDAVVAVSGRIGTLNELTIAYDEGKVIGVMRGTGGISDRIEDIVEMSGKKGGMMIYEQDPRILIRKVFEIAKNSKT